jgi:hypothetical protein
MLKLLLDEHISPAVCVIARDRSPRLIIESLVEWREGALRGKKDEYVLEVAMEHGFTLVTYDLRTIPLLLRQMASDGVQHHGVIFIDERTCRPKDLAGIADVLIRLWDEMSLFDWRDRVAFAARGNEKG